MQQFRNLLKYLMPAVVVVMLLGLVLSRVYSPEGTEGPAGRVSAWQAGDYVGQRAEVCGRVASVSYRPDIGGEPTFLNFERPHPDAVFTVVIWGEARSAWDSPPEELYADRRVCVKGIIDDHEGTPQIRAQEPAQLWIER